MATWKNQYYVFRCYPTQNQYCEAIIKTFLNRYCGCYQQPLVITEFVDGKAYVGERYIVFDTKQLDAHFYRLETPSIIESVYSDQIYDALDRKLDDCFAHKYLKELEILVQQF